MTNLTFSKFCSIFYFNRHVFLNNVLSRYFRHLTEVSERNLTSHHYLFLSLLIILICKKKLQKEDFSGLGDSVSNSSGTRGFWDNNVDTFSLDNQLICICPSSLGYIINYVIVFWKQANLVSAPGTWVKILLKSSNGTWWKK